MIYYIRGKKKKGFTSPLPLLMIDNVALSDAGMPFTAAFTACAAGTQNCAKKTCRNLHRELVQVSK